jgi:hypothetical protein
MQYARPKEAVVDGGLHRIMTHTNSIRRPSSAGASLIEQSRAIAKARSALALRQDLDTRISRKQRLEQRTPERDAPDTADDAPPGSEMLVREAHRVLLRYLPAVALPDELWKVRDMLDSHMFGRDGRVHRDDVVRVARQIDRLSEGP